jgi:hypothetical protein
MGRGHHVLLFSRQKRIFFLTRFLMVASCLLFGVFQAGWSARHLMMIEVTGQLKK